MVVVIVIILRRFFTRVLLASTVFDLVRVSRVLWRATGGSPGIITTIHSARASASATAAASAVHPFDRSGLLLHLGDAPL